MKNNNHARHRTHDMRQTTGMMDTGDDRVEPLN
jgi:hypothetical protein